MSSCSVCGKLGVECSCLPTICSGGDRCPDTELHRALMLCLRRKPVCKYVWSCEWKDNPKHLEEYWHEFLLKCQNGALCSLQEDKRHTKKYSHPCTNKECHQRGDAVHNLERTHSPLL